MENARHRLLVAHDENMAGRPEAASERGSSRLKARRSDRRHEAVHETFLAKAEMLAREKPVARECSKKRKPPNECANTIALFVSNKLPSLGGGETSAGTVTRY